MGLFISTGSTAARKSHLLFIAISYSFYFHNFPKVILLNTAGDYRDTLRSIASIFVCSHHISNNWVLLVSLQSLVVLLCNLLHISLLCLSRNAASFNNTRHRSSFHIGYSSLHHIKSILRLPSARKGNSSVVLGCI